MYSINGLKSRDTGLFTLWGSLQYLKGPVMNIRQAAFLHGSFTDLAADIAVY